MDQVSKRYSDPCFFMNGMIQTCRFEEFVSEFVKTVSQEKEDELDWEFFLHKVFEGSFQDFKESLKIDKENKDMSMKDIEATVQDSLSILNNFNPK